MFKLIPTCLFTNSTKVRICSKKFFSITLNGNNNILKKCPNLKFKEYKPVANINSFSIGTFCVQQRFLSNNSIHLNKSSVTVTYCKSDGERITVQGREGDDLLDIAVNNDIDLPGYGACEGTLSCSTCHLIFKQGDFDKIDEPATDEELDMLDLAYGLTDTSRLGCQVCITKELDGIEVEVPEGTADARNS